MVITDAQLQAWLATFFWPFLRIGAVVMSAPVLNSTQVPMRWRMLLTVLLTLIIAPTVREVPLIDPFGVEFYIVVVQQVLIGISMGILLQMVFSAMVFSGQVIAHKMGLGFAMMVDPQNGVQVPVVSQYFMIFTTFVFLFLNGHLILIEVLARSFETLPVGVGFSREDYRAVVAWGSEMFAGGMLVALPTVAALLLVNLSFGVIARAAPQLHIFAIGFPMAILVGFLMIWISLPVTVDGFMDLLDNAFLHMRSILRIGS